MSYLVALDDGHGLDTPGNRTPLIPELGRQIQENEFNHAVKEKLKTALKRCGINYIDVSPERDDTPLATRVKRANDAKADIFVSIHYNAYDGKFDTHKGGLSVFHHPNKDGKLAKLIHKYLKRGTEQYDRGVLTGNFYVLRETKMPSALSESGFMDDRKEALLMIDENFQREVAEEHAQGICEYFGVSYVAANGKEGDDQVPYKRGDKGPEIAEIQTALIALGYGSIMEPHGADGSFGPLTEKAVTAFQKDNGIPQTGSVDYRTLAKLEQLYRKSIESKVSKYIQYFKLQKELAAK